jgi:hypothetical protein
MDADYGEGSGPQQAPRRLTRIGRQAQRVFDGPPWLASVLRAVVFLVGYGAIWLLVRGQHPYRGPDTAVLAVAWIAVVIATVASVKSLRSPSAGWAQKQKDVRAAVLPAAHRGARPRRGGPLARLRRVPGYRAAARRGVRLGGRRGRAW